MSATRDSADAALYAGILDAAVEVVGADAGSIQAVDEERNGLRLVDSHGFHPASAAFWELVRSGSLATCGAALAAAERVVVEDVEAVPVFAGSEDLREWRRSGLRAVQSTPLVARDGRMLGMLSTHWSAPHELSEEELRLIDVLAHLADRARRPLYCAWCSRIEIDGAFRPADFLRRAAPALRGRVRDVVCRECVARRAPAAPRTRPPDSLRRELDEQLRATVARNREGLERARASLDSARAATRRAQLLRAFFAFVRDDPHRLLTRCAWCDRLGFGEEWVPREHFLYHGLPDRLRDRTTHGICPDCLSRQLGVTKRPAGEG